MPPASLNVLKRTGCSLCKYMALCERNGSSPLPNVMKSLSPHICTCTWSVRKVSDRIFLCEHLMDYNLARLHEPTLNLSAHA